MRLNSIYVSVKTEYFKLSEIDTERQEGRLSFISKTPQWTPDYPAFSKKWKSPVIPPNGRDAKRANLTEQV